MNSKSPLQTKPILSSTTLRLPKFPNQVDGIGTVRKAGGRSSSPAFRLPGTRTGGGLRLRLRRALPLPAPLPGGHQLAAEKRKPKEAGNPEVLLSRGLGDSFEWNRADSSPVLRARSLLSVRRCPRRCVATRPGRMQTATSRQASLAEPRGGPGTSGSLPR